MIEFVLSSVLIGAADDLLARGAIQVAGRLIGQHESRLHDGSPGSGDTLARPPASLSGRCDPPGRAEGSGGVPYQKNNGHHHQQSKTLRMIGLDMTPIPILSIKFERLHIRNVGNESCESDHGKEIRGDHYSSSQEMHSVGHVSMDSSIQSASPP
jgi:hypothetical protein